VSHRDRPDLGTHLSLGENRGSYVRATDLHLSLRSFRDNHSQSTLPLRNEFVNATAKVLWGVELNGLTLCVEEYGGERCNAAVVHGGAQVIGLSSKQLRP
jgi:hypothetical protein